MLNHFGRGAAIGLAFSFFACFALFIALPLVPFLFFFLLALLAWSLLRLVQEALRSSHRRTAEPWRRECFFFWFGSVVSCLFAPVPFAIVGAIALHHMYSWQGAP